MYSSPVKVNRRRSLSSTNDQQNSCRKRLSFASEPTKKNPAIKNSLRVAVLKNNYKKTVLEASSARKQIRIENEKLKLIACRRSMNFTHNPYESPAFLRQQLKEKSEYVQQLELEINEAKAKRQRTEANEEQMKAMLEANKTYINSILKFFKISRQEDDN